METCRRWLHGRGELNWTLEQRDEKLRIFIICGLNPEKTWGEQKSEKAPSRKTMEPISLPPTLPFCSLLGFFLG
jgi:hypothetical protein